MATSRLWPGNPTPGNTSNHGAQYTCGPVFVPQVDGWVTELWWYQGSSDSTDWPVRIRIWRQSDGQVEVNTTSITSGPAGEWRRIILGTPVPLTNGVQYRMGADLPANGDWWWNALDSPPTPGSLLAFGTPATAYLASSYGYPDSSGTVHWAIDLTFSDTETPAGPSPDAPQTNQEASDLADQWFSADSGLNMHESDLPWLTYAAIQTLDAKIDDIATSVGTGLAGKVDDIKTSVGTGLAGKVDDIKTSVGTSLNAVATAAKTAAEAAAAFATTAFQWEEDFFSAIYNATGWDAASYGAKMADTLGNLFKWIGALGRSGAVPATGWTLIDSQAFDGDLVWAQPADLYVVTFSDVGANDTTTLVSGVDVVYCLGWWMPINGTEPVGQRRFIDTPIAEVSDGGARMPGILLHCPRGGAGTVDAWQFTG